MRDLRGFDRVAIDFSARKIFFDVPDGAMDGGVRTWSGAIPDCAEGGKQARWTAVLTVAKARAKCRSGHGT